MQLTGSTRSGLRAGTRRCVSVCDEESILLLGGSRQQVIAIETAKRLGYRTVLCDYLPDNPGQHYADVFYQESTTDRERMLQIAREERVSGVLAYSSDPAAPTAAYVAEELGLPTNPLSAVETLSVKHLFRQHLKKYGFSCPRTAVIFVDSSVDELMAAASQMSRPVVLKPTDSSGSKGVSVIDAPNRAEFSAALDRARGYSRNGVLLLEEYVQSSFPRVVGGDIFVVGGEVKFWGLMSCLRDSSLGGLVPVGERNPSGLSPRQERRVRDQVQALVTSLGIRFGELNVEIILGRNDTPFILELGARAGGNMIPVQLSDLSGIDLVEANVRCAMGDFSMDVSFDGSDEPVCTYVLHSNRSGIFSGVRIDPRVERYVYRHVMYVEKGARIDAFDGANKALGILFLRFESVIEMETILERHSQLFAIECV